MKTSVELRQLQSLKRAEGANIVSKAENEKRELNETELVSLRSIETELTAFDVQIKDAELREKFAANKVANNPTPNASNDSEKRELQNFSISKLIKEVHSRGIDGVTGFERELMQESEKEARDLNANVNGAIYLSNKVMNAANEKRTQSATGTANLGGNTINTEKVGFFDALYNRTVLAELGVTNYSGLSANTDLVGWDATPVAYWAGENATQSPTDATFANRSLRPKLLGSAVDISMLLNIQSNVSVDANMIASMQRVMAVAFEAAVINGDGTNKPTGILSYTPAINNVAMGTNGAVPTYAKILELITATLSANADPSMCKFLTNFKVRSILKRTAIDTGSGAMVMGYNNQFGSQMDVIDGYQTVVTNNVPSTLTKGSTSGTCSTLIFGDFSQVVTAQFGGVLLNVDNISSAQRRNGQYGITMNMFVDSGVKQPKALGSINDLITV